jgi:hypothetical protein
VLKPSSSLLRRIGDVFPPGRQRPSRKHPNKFLQGGQRRPKTPLMLTPAPRPGRLSPDASPMSTQRQRKRCTTSPTATIRSVRGKHLGSPQPTTGQRHGSRDTSPANKITDIDRTSPDPHQRAPKEGSRPQQPQSPTDRPPTGEPPLHLGHKIGPRLSTRSAEVANRQRPPPNSHRDRPQATNSIPST